MLEAVGHAVSRLIRIRYGAMLLPRGLKRGTWMELDDADIRALVQASGGRKAPSKPGEAGEGLQQRPRGDRRGGSSGGPRGNGQRVPNQLSDEGVLHPGRSRNKVSNRRTDYSALRQAGVGQPDPMKTAFGYIGADSFTRQRQDGGQRPRGGGGNGQRRNGRSR